MKAAALHLLDLGHRRIALIGGAAVRPALERRAGLEEAFAERHLPPTYTVDEGIVLRRARRRRDAPRCSICPSRRRR